MKTKNKHTKKCLVAFGCWCMCLPLAHAQQISNESLSTAGQTYAGASATLSWNLGETVIVTLGTSSAQITQGFEQPESITLGKEEVQEENSLNVYPNPASSFITLAYHAGQSLDIVLYDMKGAVVMEKNNLAAPGTLDLDALETGMYMLTVKSNGNLLQRTKIQKVL